jgi:hypothetical protein
MTGYEPGKGVSAPLYWSVPPGGHGIEIIHNNTINKE